MEIIRFLVGLFFIIFIAYLFSSDRKNISWKLIFSGVLLQMIFALLISNVSFIESIFRTVSEFLFY